MDSGPGAQADRRQYDLSCQALVAAMMPRSESTAMTMRKTTSRQDAAGTSLGLREGFSVDTPLSEVAADAGHLSIGESIVAREFRAGVRLPDQRRHQRTPTLVGEVIAHSGARRWTEHRHNNTMLVPVFANRGCDKSVEACIRPLYGSLFEDFPKARNIREIRDRVAEVAPRIASYLHFAGLQQMVTKRARVTGRDAPARRGCYDARIEGWLQGQADHGDGILERDLLPFIDGDRVEGGLVLDPQTGVLSWAQDVDGGESEAVDTSR